MPRLKRLSGEQVLAILSRHGFSIHSQKGSHVKMRRVTGSGIIQTLTMPRHHDLDIGTLQAIFRQASRFVSDDELRNEFYSE